MCLRRRSFPNRLVLQKAVNELCLWNEQIAVANELYRWILRLLLHRSWLQIKLYVWMSFFHAIRSFLAQVSSTAYATCIDIAHCSTMVLSCVAILPQRLFVDHVLAFEGETPVSTANTNSKGMYPGYLYTRIMYGIVKLDKYSFDHNTNI
jgi:hypothetical protein